MRRIGGVVLLAAGLVLMAMLVRQAAQTAGDVYFWIFSAIAVVGAVRVITHEKPVYSALYFVLTVVASAGLFVLLWAEFMAAALILIYAGAILVTYVFVIMLAQQTQVSGSGVEEIGGAWYDRESREPVVATAVGFVLMGVLLFLIFDKAEGMRPASGAAKQDVSVETSTRALGRYLFSDQAIALELAGLILTLSMVGAVVIARRRVTAEPVMHGDVLAAEGASGDMLTKGLVPAGPDDNPHTIPVYGTWNPKAKEYPER
jgi:NADH-quinone oxidoreductase subunit J